MNSTHDLWMGGGLLLYLGYLENIVAIILHICGVLASILSLLTLIIYAFYKTYGYGSIWMVDNNEMLSGIMCPDCRIQSQIAGLQSKLNIKYVHLQEISGSTRSKVHQINDMTAETMKAAALQNAATKTRYNHLFGKKMTGSEENNNYLRSWQRGWNPVKEGTLKSLCLHVLVEQQDDHDKDKKKFKYSPIDESTGLYFDLLNYAYGKVKASRDGKIVPYPRTCPIRGSFKLNSTTVRLDGGYQPKSVTLSGPLNDNAMDPFILWEADWYSLRAGIPHVQGLMQNSINDEVSVIVGSRLSKLHVDKAKNVHLTIVNCLRLGPPHMHCWASSRTRIPHSDWKCLVWNQAVIDCHFLPFTAM